MENIENTENTPKNKGKKIIYWVLIGIFAAIFLVSGTIVVDYLIGSYQHQQQMDDLRGMHTQSPGESSVIRPTGNNTSSQPDNPGSSSTVPSGTGSNTTDPSDPVPPSSSGTNHPRPTTPPRPTRPIDGNNPPDPTIPTKPNDTNPTILSEMQGLYDLNSDVVGWIKIPGTNIDYPVMQTKKDPDYYIDRDFFGEYDKRGSIYAEEHCDVFDPSDVVVLHGHHMADGSMFRDIKDFKYKSFFNDHKYVYFDTLYEHRTYEVVLVFRTNGEISDKYPFFPFHIYNNFKDEADFNNFMTSIRELALQQSKVKVEYGDKLLCMSTCDYSPYPNGRMVLVAKLIEN